MDNFEVLNDEREAMDTLDRVVCRCMDRGGGAWVEMHKKLTFPLVVVFAMS